MQIMSIRPAPFGVGERTIALFDVELSPEVRVYNLALRRNGEGQLRTVSPNSQGRHCVTFSTGLSSKITAAAYAELNGGRPANDRNRTSAA